MGVQSQQQGQKASPTVPAVTGGKNAQGGGQQQQGGMQGMPSQNAMMGMLGGQQGGMMHNDMRFPGFGGVPGQQGAQGQNQGFRGAMGTMNGPNSGGAPGFAQSATGTLTGGPSTQPGGNIGAGGGGVISPSNGMSRL